jgi:ABC-type molybdate transport system substrate-binding protein
LRSDVRVGTSTPVADPSGDYAFALFRRAEELAPGARAKLESKALQLTVRINARSEAQDFAKFLISPSAQAMFLKLGFEAP